MSLLARGVLLVVIWVLAWGSAAPATVVVGVVLAALLLVAFPPTDATARFRLRIRPVALLRLLAYLGGQLVTSNLLVAREILSGRSRIDTHVIVHEVGHGILEGSDLRVCSHGKRLCWIRTIA